jgi:hypothetical protein
MTLATQPTVRSRPRLSPVTAARMTSEETSFIEIVENPIHRHDAALGAAVEEHLRRILRDESLGAVAVRFRVCRDDAGEFQFICKVENPPRVDTDVAMPWRWWSPLLASAEEFAAALEDGLRARRARLSTSPSLR